MYMHATTQIESLINADRELNPDFPVKKFLKMFATIVTTDCDRNGEETVVLGDGSGPELLIHIGDDWIESKLEDARTMLRLAGIRPNPTETKRPKVKKRTTKRKAVAQ